VLIQLLVQPLTSRRGDLESSAVSHQLHDISSAIQYCAAVGTVLKMRGHSGTETGIHFTVKIVGDVSPYLFAVDLDGLFSHALPPFPSSIRIRLRVYGV
jgi:hypothetical protein